MCGSSPLFLLPHTALESSVVFVFRWSFNDEIGFELALTKLKIVPCWDVRSCNGGSAND